MRLMTTILFFALFAAPQAMAQDGGSVPNDADKKLEQTEEAKPSNEAPSADAKGEETSPEPATMEVPKRAPTSNQGEASQSGSKGSSDDGGERFPHGSSWSGNVYGASGWWASVHVGGGLNLVQVNEGIASSGSQMVQGFAFGSTLHASHLWALSLDLAMTSITLKKGALQPGWTEYKAQNLLVTFGGKIYPWAHEVCSVALGAHVGLNQYSSHVKGDVVPEDQTEIAWSGPELVVGGVVEFSYYPMHALEIGLNVRVDSLLGGENDKENEWEGAGAPSSSRMLVGANLLLGFHF